MAKKLGNDYKLYIADAAGGTFSLVKGQGTLSRSNKADTIDTTSKDDYPFKTKAPGSRDSDLSLDLFPDLPDASGFTRLKTLADASPPAPFNIQIRKAPFAVGDVEFAGSVYATELSVDYPKDGVVSAKVTLVLAAPPTVDILS